MELPKLTSSDESCLVDCLGELPYTEDTELVTYNSDIYSSGINSLERNVYMAAVTDAGNQYEDEVLRDISADKATVDAPQDENEEQRARRREKNAKRAQLRRDVMEHQQRATRNLNIKFAAAANREHYAARIANIVEDREGYQVSPMCVHPTGRATSPTETSSTASTTSSRNERCTGTLAGIAPRPSQNSGT